MSLNIFSMFDGVGGFIVGLNDANEAIEKEMFRTTYSNQFEPSKKHKMHMKLVYIDFQK